MPELSKQGCAADHHGAAKTLDPLRTASQADRCQTDQQAERVDAMMPMQCCVVLSTLSSENADDSSVCHDEIVQHCIMMVRTRAYSHIFRLYQDHDMSPHPTPAHLCDLLHKLLSWCHAMSLTTVSRLSETRGMYPQPPTFAICCTSSRVGAMMSAMGPSPSRSSAWSRMCRNMGSTNASVLPLPVLAMPMQSRPLMMMGNACKAAGRQHMSDRLHLPQLHNVQATQSIMLCSEVPQQSIQHVPEQQRVSCAMGFAATAI